MNSDPYDSAVWRSFGMLDADETAIFDEASRVDPLLRGAFLEMDRLSAAIAVASTTPVEPKAGQLERLQSRLGLHISRRSYGLAALTGWAAAAALAVMWLLDHGRVSGPTGDSHNLTRQTAPAEVTPAVSPNPAPNPVNPDASQIADQPAQESPPPIASVDSGDLKTKVRAETKRLVQEIEVLRDNLEKYQNRDRVLFEAVPGMALPIVMTMNPPGMLAEDPSAIAKNDEHSPITAMLGDAVRVMTAGNMVTAGDAGDAGDAAIPSSPTNPLPSDHPTAIPIYDAARDSGTLVVSNLPPAEQGQAYNLWVKTLNGDKPVYVGSLPADSAKGAGSFDFSLGSNMVLPSGFMLTKDPVDRPASPGKANTVLQGPPTPGR